MESGGWVESVVASAHQTTTAPARPRDRPRMPSDDREGREGHRCSWATQVSSAPLLASVAQLERAR